MHVCETCGSVFSISGDDQHDVRYILVHGNPELCTFEIRCRVHPSEWPIWDELGVGQ